MLTLTPRSLCPQVMLHTFLKVAVNKVFLLVNLLSVLQSAIPSLLSTKKYPPFSDYVHKLMREAPMQLCSTEMSIKFN